MAADLGRLVATLEARAERFDLTLQRATGKLDKIAEQTERSNQRIARSTATLDGIATRAAKGITVLGTALAGAATAVAYFAARQVAALDNLGDLAAQTGLTATELRKLQVGLELNGGTAEQAGAGLTTFARNLGQVEAGTGRLTGLLKKLDPAFLESLRSAGSTGEALRLVADRIAVARSEQEKLSIATAAFGPAGRQFVLLLADGASGVDALGKRLESLGIGNLDEVTAAAQRFDDQLKLLKATVTTQFTTGLLGVGEGLNAISDALDDQTVKNLGEAARSFGELTAWIAKVETQELLAWSRFFLALKNGEGIGSAVDQLNEGLAPLDLLNEKLREVDENIRETRRNLREIGAPDEIANAPGVFPPQRAGIERERVRLLEFQRERDRILAQIASRQPFVGPLPEVRTPVLSTDGLAPLGARGLDKEAEAARKKVEAEREKLLQGNDQFVESMRQSSLGALTEAEKLSLDLAETLGKIGSAAQAGTITAAEAFEFQTAAIEEATAALEAAQARADEITAKAQRDVQRELLQRSARIEGESLTGLSQATERELARAEAIVESSNLDEKIREAYAGGNPVEMEAALARNRELLEADLADINSSLDETLGSIAEIGRETLGDFFRGIAEGSEASFGDMAKSFLLRLAEMEAAAVSADLIANLTGKGGESTSITGRILGGVVDSVSGDDAEKAVDAGSEIGSALLDSIETGAGSLLNAGKGAASALGDSASALLRAGLDAAAALIEAAAASAATSGISLFAAGGAVTPRGIERLERIHALADGGAAAGGVRALTGEAGTERLLRLDEVAEIASRSGGDRGRAIAMAKRVGERLDRPEIRDLGVGDIVIPDRKMGAFFDRVMPRARLADGGAIRSLDSFSPLAGMAGDSGVFGRATQSANVVVNVQPPAGHTAEVRRTRGPSLQDQIDVAVVSTFSRQMRSNGPLAQTIQPNGPTSGLR